MHLNNTRIQQNSLPNVGNGESINKNYSWSNIYTYTPFSKTHCLLLAMERADQERNRLQHTHIHNTREHLVKLTG